MTVFLSCLLNFVRLCIEGVGQMWRSGGGGGCHTVGCEEGCAKPFASIRQAVLI
jgi:hypothetical protein